MREIQISLQNSLALYILFVSGLEFTTASTRYARISSVSGKNNIRIIIRGMMMSCVWSDASPPNVRAVGVRGSACVRVCELCVRYAEHEMHLGTFE